MTTLRFSLPYLDETRRVPKQRIANVVVDIEEISPGDAPVAILHRAWDRDVEYRLYDGHYWVPATYRPMDVEKFLTKNTQQYAKTRAGWRLENHMEEPFLDYDDLERLVWKRKFTGGVDSGEMSEKFLASATWRHVRDRASDLILVDGQFLERSVGPVLQLPSGLDRSLVTLDRAPVRPAILRWLPGTDKLVRSLDGHARTFGMAETDLALGISVEVAGGPLQIDTTSTPRFEIEPQEPHTAYDLLGIGIEERALDIAFRCSPQHLAGMERGLLDSIVSLRVALQERFPASEIDFTDETTRPGRKVWQPVPDTSALLAGVRTISAILPAEDLPRGFRRDMRFIDRRLDAMTEMADDTAALGVTFPNAM